MTHAEALARHLVAVVGADSAVAALEILIREIRGSL